MTHCGPKGGHRSHHAGCCCCGQGGGFPRHFLSKEERRKKLEDYRDDLKAELAEVEKRLQSADAED